MRYFKIMTNTSNFLSFFQDLITGQGPKASGKTELLYQLLTNCILPKEWRGIELGGHECGVLLFDTDLKFDLQRVLTLLHYKFVQYVQ
jgi:hypothetical protein